MKVYDFAHPIIQKTVKPNTFVLDIGCGSGALGQQLKLKGCTVHGIDHCKQALKIAKERLDKAFYLDLEQDDLPQNKYDVIIIADVLEHIKNPKTLLRRAQDCLAEDAELIISIPNVANWNVRLNLLLGRFNYRDEGIMDKTHIKFYTLRTAKELIRDTGLTINKLQVMPGSPIPVRIFPKLKMLLSKMFKKLFAEGFILTTTKKFE